MKEIKQLTPNDISSAHSIASFIKMWISFLPQSIFTEKYTEDFLTSEFIKSDSLRISSVFSLSNFFLLFILFLHFFFFFIFHFF